MKTIYDVPIILRREIEALMVKPFIDAFEKELGCSFSHKMQNFFASFAK